jgi:nucleotide-binding universal stress UspA family protein
VYRNVIVPNDGTPEGRVAAAPASDLAWRCGAKTVFVSNTGATDRQSKEAVKLQAQARSEADIEYWVDLEHPLPEAAIQAAGYRENPIYCLATPRPTGLLARRRPTVGQVLPELVARATEPIVVIGPQVDTAQGLPMTELILVLDGMADSDALLDVAAGWAKAFKMRLVLTSVPAVGTTQERSEMQQYLDRRAELADAPAGVSVELVGGDGGIDGLLALFANHDSAMAMMVPGPQKVGLARFAESVILASPLVVVLARRA